MMNDNDDLPSAGMDPFASPVKQIDARPSSRLSRGLLIAGGLSLAVRLCCGDRRNGRTIR